MCILIGNNPYFGVCMISWMYIPYQISLYTSLHIKYQVLILCYFVYNDDKPGKKMSLETIRD